MAVARSSRPTTLLLVVLGLLMIDSIIELSFISSMVAFLHRRAGGDYLVKYNGSVFALHGKPYHMLVNQGHTSNGAAGTAFVLVGLGGILVLTLLSRYSDSNYDRKPRLVVALHHVWLVSTVLSALLTLAALIYTFVVTSQTSNQSINVNVAASLPNQPYPNYIAYPLNTWTPETWFSAVLVLPLAGSDDRSSIETRRRIMIGWRWNLIPMFILGVLLCVVAVRDALVKRRDMRQRLSSYQSKLEQ